VKIIVKRGDLSDLVKTSGEHQNSNAASLLPEWHNEPGSVGDIVAVPCITCCLSQTNMSDMPKQNYFFFVNPE